MPRHAIHLTDPKTGEKTKHILDLTEEEIKTLEAYLQYVAELSAIEIVRQGVPCGLTVHMNEKGMSWKAQNPDDRDVCHMLHRLRPLILTSEHASYARVSGILGKKITDAQLRAFLKSQRALYDGRTTHSIMQITSAAGADQVRINSEEILQTWLNSSEYHRDQDKKEELERFHKLLPVAATKPIFLILIWDKIQAIQHLARLIEVTLGKLQTWTMHLTTPPA
jgi:hypothetical protein